MKVSYLVAKRIAFNNEKSFSSFIIRIAIIAVALSVATLILSSCLITGFQKAISNKLFNSWGHIHITSFLPDASNFSNETSIVKNDKLLNQLKNIPEVVYVNTYITQSCIAKSPSSLDGILLKGFDKEATLTTLKNYLKEGRMPLLNDTSNTKEIVISAYLQRSMNVKLGDFFLLYFINKNEAQPKVRKVTICGIYETGLEEYDKMICFVDTKLIQSVNDWEQPKIQGYELYLNDMNTIEKVKSTIDNQLPEDLYTYTLKERFSTIFSWLELMKKNELVIFVITLIVAIINMITAILILILERTRMIGVLKSLGYKNKTIQEVFIISCTFITLVGILLGNIVGLGLAFIQQKFGVISLDQTIYYISKAPIYFDVMSILIINIVTLLACMLLLIVPSFIINKINIVKAISFK
jgi:lipoprotein-releasing system permease protein